MPGQARCISAWPPRRSRIPTTTASTRRNVRTCLPPPTISKGCAGSSVPIRLLSSRWTGSTAQRVALREAHCSVDPVHREESKRIGTDEPAHPFEVMGGGKQVLTFRRVDAVVVGMRDRRGGHAEMHLACPGIAHHLDDLERGGAAYD